MIRGAFGGSSTTLRAVMLTHAMIWYGLTGTRSSPTVTSSSASENGSWRRMDVMGGPGSLRVRRNPERRPLHVHRVRYPPVPTEDGLAARSRRGRTRRHAAPADYIPES